MQYQPPTGQPRADTYSQPQWQEQPSQWPPQLQQKRRRWSYADWYSRQPLHVRIPILAVLAVFVIMVVSIGIMIIAATIHVIATGK